MKNYYLLALFLLVSATLFAQSFYVVNSTNDLYKITVNGTNVSQQTISKCSSNMGSIAVYKNTMYYIGDVVMGKAAINGNTLTDCSSLTGSVATSSLTSDINGILYLTAGAVLYKYDPGTNSQTSLGTMPYTASGDLIFYKNEMYMASNKGIVKVNITNPAASTLVIPADVTIFGLASVAFSSTQNKVYALSINNNGSTNIIELDLDNGALGQIVGTLPYTVFDAASAVEDGSLIEVKIDAVNAVSDCPYNGKGTVTVVCNNTAADFQYSLNNITNATGVFTGVSPGTYTVTVISGNTSKQTFITISQFEMVKPLLNIGKINPACLNKGQIVIAAENNASLYDIKYDGGLYSFDHTFVGLKAGSYHFDILNKSGCVVDAQDIVLVQDACGINVNPVVIAQECAEPAKAMITVTPVPGTDIYTYTLNKVTNTTGVFNNIDAGIYTLNITSAGGGNKNIQVVVPDYKLTNPVISVIKKDAICDLAGDIKFNLSVKNSNYLVKYNGISYPFDHDFANMTEGTYSFSFLKPNGCVLDTMSVILAKEACEVILFPNAFTPNGDGVNDIFRASQTGKADNFKFKIYTRSGMQVFTSDSSKNGWDGRYKDKTVPTGVYYWIATYINNEGKALSRKGYVTLIR